MRQAHAKAWMTAPSSAGETSGCVVRCCRGLGRKVVGPGVRVREPPVKPSGEGRGLRGQRDSEAGSELRPKRRPSP